MQREVHDLRPRHLQRRLSPGQAARTPLLELGMDRRDADGVWPSRVLLNGCIDEVVIEAELMEHLEEPRTLGAKQPVWTQVQAILRCDVGWVDVWERCVGEPLPSPTDECHS